MKAALSLIFLASSALGGNAPGGWAKGPGKVQIVTLQVGVTYTTRCPFTETHSKAGKTWYSTYTTTSVVETMIPTTTQVTQTGPPVVKTVGNVVYTTATQLQPITETKIIDGSTVEVVWTSTSTFYTRLEQTQTVYTTNVQTAYAQTETYETVTCPETVYTTVSEGETFMVTKTNTVTNVVSKVNSITTVVPVTLTKNAAITDIITDSEGVTFTDYSTTVETSDETFYSETTEPPNTVVIPITSIQIDATTSAVPAQVTGAASPNTQKMSPGVAVLAGALGALALVV
ncbi:hypothetical protein B0T17DRAFT_635258 [Bombardia bombarda]|uniref:Repetitive proline-rich cell wall protein n=1 Tax=Bombardia bombarda TaxID=252184 RepID=A0AA40C991_9PEZI|nr:hypothetical protein B0T17DRAFT_635258 [Bombardia bombarda]